MRISTTIPAALLANLEQRAMEEGRSLSNLVAYLLESSLDKSSSLSDQAIHRVASALRPSDPTSRRRSRRLSAERWLAAALAGRSTDNSAASPRSNRSTLPRPDTHADHGSPPGKGPRKAEVMKKGPSRPHGSFG